MIRYASTREDDAAVMTAAWVRSWWASLPATELAAMLPAFRHSLEGFCAAFAPPTRSFFTVDDRGLRVVVWGRPWLQGATVGLWVRRDRRSCPSSLRAVLAGLQALLEEFPVLVALVSHPGHLRAYRRGGWIFGDAAVPGLWDGRDCWVGWLTADRLAMAKETIHG